MIFFILLITCIFPKSLSETSTLLQKKLSTLLDGACDRPILHCDDAPVHGQSHKNTS